jgi:NDP-sugar pyrophosphorylase family protein
MEPRFKFLTAQGVTHQAIDEFKKNGIFFVPVLDEQNGLVEILNLHEYKALLPVDTVIMAGGKGQRLMPLTKNTPKPLLKVGDKPIIEHTIDRLSQFGIRNLHISINYLGDQLVSHFGDGNKKNLNIQYVREKEPLGTIGSVKLIDGFENDIILVMNSDILTTIDFYEFYEAFVKEDADMAIAATTYQVDIPYAVLEVNEANVLQSLKEKPRYTYYSNAGIYFMKKSVIDYIPKDTFYDVTDLITFLVSNNKKVISFPLMGYWLDIGKHEDYKKAQQDINHLNFNS